MPDSIAIGILIALVGSLGAACMGAAGRRFGFLSTWVLCLSTALGAVAGLLFFLTDHEPVLTLRLSHSLNLGFSVDYLSAIFFTLINGITCLVAWFSISYLKQYQSVYHLPSLQMLMALFVGGMQGTVLADTPVWFMVFWECMSVSTFFLVLADRTRQSIRAALLYFVMAQAGALAIFAGFLLLEPRLAFSLSTHTSVGISAAASLPFFLFLFGFGSKAGLVPLHVWLPEAHPQAPSHISALMSGVMLKVAVYGFLRVLLILPSMPEGASILVIGMGSLSAIVGVLNAVLQRDIKKILAFSSIENIGIIFTMVGISMWAADGGIPGATSASSVFLSLAIFAAVNHALFKSGLFMAAGTIIVFVHNRSLEAMGGLAKRMPLFSRAFLVLVLAAAALPPFGMFFVEWGFIQNIFGLLRGVTSGLSAALFVMVLTLLTGVGGMAIFAMVKMFGIAMLGVPRTEHAVRAKEPAAGMLIPVCIAGLGTFLAGWQARPLMRLIAGYGYADGIAVQNYHSALAPLGVILALILGMVCVWLLRRIGSDAKRERLFHTWDCGQPIDASMEYTATAFSAPIRFFSQFLMRAHKDISTVPVVATNPWITRKEITLQLPSIWWSKAYRPFAGMLMWSSAQARRLQNGRVQFYLLLIVISVCMTLIAAL